MKKLSVEQQLYENVKLAEEQSRRSPYDLLLKRNLAQALLKHGQYEKYHSDRYDEARKIFEQLLQIQAGHADALYHLGYIALIDRQYEQAYQYFVTFLECEHIEKQSEAKAYGYMAAARFLLHDDDEAEELLLLSKETSRSYGEFTNQGSDFAVKIKLSRSKQRNPGEPSQNSRYIFNYIKRTSMDVCEISADKYESESSRFHGQKQAERGSVILDMASADPVFFNEKGKIVLTKIYAGLLLKLMEEAPNPVAQSEITDIINEKYQDCVKVLINRLRQKLQPLFDQPIEEVIVTVSTGHRQKAKYQWGGTRRYTVYERIH